mmetsp:Transcript_109385/g.244423  ORF Transcript_109385/g.244423 Transcript_109385/m.244423 type:complete len:218 (+) Transcript_109385:62-715(+)
MVPGLRTALLGAQPGAEEAWSPPVRVPTRPRCLQGELLAAAPLVPGARRPSRCCAGDGTAFLVGAPVHRGEAPATSSSSPPEATSLRDPTSWHRHCSAVHTGFLSRSQEAQDEAEETAKSAEIHADVAEEAVEKSEEAVDDMEVVEESAEEAEGFVIALNVGATAILVGVAASTWLMYLRWKSHRRDLAQCWRAARGVSAADEVAAASGDAAGGRTL